jgi:RNA polymerase sigma-70 factor (ECF subfamily)
MSPQDAEDRHHMIPDLEEHRSRLLALARRNLNPVLTRRFSPEDVVQETFSAAYRKADFLRNCPEIPVYCKLRRLLFQTITDLERKHLQSRKRDAYRECEVAGADLADARRDREDDSPHNLDWNLFADTVTGPLTQIARQDRYELLRKTMESLPEHDREILELRHFDGMSNSECAEALHLTQAAASVRYVRALEHLKKQLIEFTEFRT